MDELSVPHAERTAIARRVVVIETRRRATFPHRLRVALEKLGLAALGGLHGADPSDFFPERRASDELLWETSLRLLQYRHGFLLDRRYARAIRQLPLGAAPDVIEGNLGFHADTLPGQTPSEEAAISRLAHPRMAYPQRAAWLPANAPCFLQHKRGQGATRVGAAAPRDRKNLPDLLSEHRLDGHSRPALEELLQGRDLELCAMAPVSTTPEWDDVFTPELLVPMPWDFYQGHRLDEQSFPPELMRFPKSARFSWQIGQNGGGPQRYHRMAIYTTPDDASAHSTGEAAAVRTCTPAERQVCADLREHGLRPKSVLMASLTAMPARPPPAAQRGATDVASDASTGSGMKLSGSVMDPLEEEEAGEIAAALMQQMHVHSLTNGDGAPIGGAQPEA